MCPPPSFCLHFIASFPFETSRLAPIRPNQRSLLRVFRTSQPSTLNPQLFYALRVHVDPWFSIFPFLGRCTEGPGRWWKVLEGSGRCPPCRRVEVRRRRIKHPMRLCCLLFNSVWLSTLNTNPLNFPGRPDDPTVSDEGSNCRLVHLKRIS